MTREELLALVNKELGSTKLTISEKTINEELDDVLEDFGEDEAVNAKLVTKVTNRLKRMDGNLHSDVSQQVKEYKKKAKERQKAKETELDEEEPEKDEIPNEEDMPEWAKKLIGEVKKEREAREQKEAADAKKALVNSIKEGLKAKFEKANIPLNSFSLRQLWISLRFQMVKLMSRILSVRQRFFTMLTSRKLVSIQTPSLEAEVAEPEEPEP